MPYRGGVINPLCFWFFFFFQTSESPVLKHLQQDEHVYA